MTMKAMIPGLDCVNWRTALQVFLVAWACSQWTSIASATACKTESQMTAAERDAQYRTALGGLLGISVIPTMLLVLLAIERNTRPENAGR